MLSTILSNSWLTAIVLNTLLIVVAWILPKKLLTPLGYLNAWVLGVLVWGTLDWQGYLVVMFYFLVGSGVTKIGMAEKEAAGIAPPGSNRFPFWFAKSKTVPCDSRFANWPERMFGDSGRRQLQRNQ